MCVFDLAARIGEIIGPKLQLRSNILLAAALLLAGPGVAQAADPASVPAEAFGRLPLIEDPVLSPNGTYFALTQRAGDRAALAIYPRAGGTPYVGLHEDAEIAFHRWATDERILLALRAAQDREGVPTTETRLVALDWNGENVRQLQDRRFNDGYFVGQIQTDIVHILPDEPDHILLSLDPDGNLTYAVFKMNIRTGRSTMVQGPIGKTFDWTADRDGDIRLRRNYDIKEGVSTWFARAKTTDQWTQIGMDSTGTDQIFTPIRFTADPDKLYVLKAVDGGTDGVYIYDLPSNRIEELVFHDPDIDPGPIAASPLTGEPLFVSFVRDRPEVRFFNANFETYMMDMQRILPDTENRIVSMTSDEKVRIIRAEAPRFPPTYYLHEVGSPNIIRLGKAYPDLSPEVLSDVRPYPYTARDGLRIAAYLTMPAGKGERSLPLVVLPHGGPHARDYIQFDWLAQFIASRGYAVLQPNFRGSAGYGDAFAARSDGEWGLSMQDDLEDGVRKLIADGIADPGRIAIVGASYGGYAALMGTVRTPDLYRCAISIAGIGDLIDLLVDSEDYSSQGYWRREIGSRWEDRERLLQVSPRRQVDRITAPILLIHGTADRSVPESQSRAMARALSSAGKDHELLILKDADHYLSRGVDRIETLKAIERFLARHMAPA